MIKWLVCSQFGHVGQTINTAHLKWPQIYSGDNQLQFFCITDFTWYTFYEGIDYIRI